MQACLCVVPITFLLLACGSNEPSPAQREDQGANIKLQTACDIDGSGSGRCNFTNLDSTPGSLCGRAIVRRTAKVIDVQRSVLKIRVDKKRHLTRPEAQTIAEQVSTQEHLEESASPIFCSGKVEQRETKAIEFVVPLVSALCAGQTSGEWNESCELIFRPEATPSEMPPSPPTQDELAKHLKSALDDIAKIEKTIDQIDRIADYVETHQLKHGSYPTKLSQVTIPPPADTNDPWGREITIRLADPVAFICSPGLDGVMNRAEGGVDICQTLPRL